MNVTGNSTDVTTYFVLRLAATGVEATGLTITNFDLQYTRTGAAPSAKADATALAAADSAHSDNCAFEVDGTDQPGLYRVDWPDAAFAAGVKQVLLTVKCATCFTEHLAVDIDAPVDVEKWLGIAPHATTINGVPVVQLHTTSGGVDGPAGFPTNFEDLSISDTTGLVSLAADQAVNVTKWDGHAVPAHTVEGVPIVQLRTAAGAGINAPANFEDLNVSDTTGLVRPDMANASGNYAGTVATVTTLTNHPDTAGTTELLTRIPDASPGANGGLPTTNGTKLNQTVDLTAGQSIACSDKTGFSLSATGADLILKSSTFVQAIVAAVNEFATYGLTALNTLLVTTGIKAASIPTPADSSGVTELLTRIPDAAPGAAGGLPTTNGTKLNQTVDLTAGQTIALPADYDAAKSAASQSSVNAVAGYVDTEMAAALVILQKIDGMLELDGALYRFTVNALEQGPTGGAVPTAIECADALLKRDWTLVSGESARSVLNALRFLRNKWMVAGETLTVMKEDDATTAWTAATTASAAADPITSVDPA